MKPKHLLFITASFDLKGGGDLSLFELIRSAVEKKYTVSAAVPKSGVFTKQLEAIGVRTFTTNHTLWHPNFKPELYGAQNIDATEKISQYIEKMGVDVVISNGMQFPWGALAAAYTNRPHAWIACEFPRFGSSYLMDHYDFVREYSNVVLANSEYLKDFMVKDLSVTNTRFYYSYVDITNSKLDTRRKDTRIVCVGNINSNKGQLDIVKAAHELKKQGKLSVPVVLIGSHNRVEKYVVELMDYIKKHSLQNDIELAGFANQPFSKLGPNDIFVQPSHSESIGRAIIEALKLGLVCVGADIEGTSEAFELSGSGILYKNGDAKDLASKLADVLVNFDSHKKLALKGQKQVLKTQSVDACHDRFFIEINKLGKGKNAHHSLRHVRAMIHGPIWQLREKDRQMKEERSRLEGQLHEVIDSKAWQTITKLRKTLYRK